MTSERLSALYGTPIEVVRVGGRIVVVAPRKRLATEPERHHPTTSRGGRGERPMGLGFYLQQPFAQHALLAGRPGSGHLRPHRTLRRHPRHGLRRARHQRTCLHRSGRRPAGRRQPRGRRALVAPLIVAGVISLLGGRERERDSAIGVILAFGLGLGVLLLSFYRGFATAATNILFGDIFGVSSGQLVLLLAIGSGVVVVMVNLYRPLLFASVDPEVAEARGPARARAGDALSLRPGLHRHRGGPGGGYAPRPQPGHHPGRRRPATLGESVRRVGASRSSSPSSRPTGACSLSLASSTVKPSVFVTAISFAIYVLARLLGPGLKGQRRVVPSVVEEGEAHGQQAIS